MAARRFSLVVLAVALGAISATTGSADTMPPRLGVDYPGPLAAYETGGPRLPLLVARAHDDVSLAGLSWQTDTGEAGAMSYECELWDCWFEATGIPLVVGFNTITVTARDAAGNATSAVLSVVARAGTRTYHVDCSAGISGDGSETSPFNDLQQAMWASAAGDTVQIDGGACKGDALVDHGLTIQGNPDHPHAELDMRGGSMEIYTPEPFTLRHLRFVEPRPEAWPRSPRVLLEDVRDATLHSWSSPPFYIVRRSEGVRFYGHASGAGIQVDAEYSTALDFSGGCYSGGFVKYHVRDSQIARMSICDHGYFDIDIARSRIEASVFDIQQYREGGCCEFDLAVRESEIFNTHLSVDRYSAGFCAGPYFPCPIPRGTILFERNRFVDSRVALRTSNQGSVPAPPVADLIVQNNLFERSGMTVELDQQYASFTSVFSALVRHNTFVDAPAGLEVLGTLVDSPAPAWSGEIANNIYSACDVGLRVKATGGLVGARVAANDFHGNAQDLDLDPGASLEGNLFAPPRFKDPAAGDYSLLPRSVCIDAGADVAEPPGVDILGRPRSVDGDKDGIARPDIGAWEFVRGKQHRLIRRDEGQK